MKIVKTALLSVFVAAGGAGGLALPLGITASMLTSAPAYAGENCHLHVGGPGQGDWYGCDSTTPGPAPQDEPDVWGALAVAPGAPGIGWANAFNYNSEGGAAETALAKCRSAYGSNAGCHVVKTVADFCLALAVSPSQHAAFVGGPIAAANFAEQNAMLQCGRAAGATCHVAVSFCADGKKHVLQGETVFVGRNPVFVPQGGGAFGRRY